MSKTTARKGIGEVLTGVGRRVRIRSCFYSINIVIVGDNSTSSGPWFHFLKGKIP